MKRSKGSQPPSRAMALPISAWRALVTLTASVVTPALSPPVSDPVRPPAVLVTGAARRLGREIALALASAGWSVALHYRGSRQDALQTATDCAARGSARQRFITLQA